MTNLSAGFGGSVAVGALDLMVPKPEVRGHCRRCARCWIYEKESDYNIVSPRGLAHIGLEYGDTACGITATGNDWWWPA